MIQNPFQGKIVIFFLVTLLHASHAKALDFKAYGFIQPESSIYINGNGRHGQDNYNTSLFGKGTFVSYLQNGDAKFTISAIGRFDQSDDQLRYLDFQKFKYEYYFDDVTLKVGNEIVFWGVNETFNIVDIINQSNLAENISGTKKLGQPMASISYNQDYGLSLIHI